jgi:hypothetical protein
VAPAVAPSAEAIVEIWEQGLYQQPIDRALTILSVLTDRPRQELAAMTLERRDSLLLERRAQLFGGSFSGSSTCVRCGCDVEVSVTADELDIPEERFVVKVADAELVVQMPTSIDLAAAARCDTVEAARRELIRRCIQGSEHDTSDDSQDSIRGDVVSAVEAELDRRAGVSAGVVQVHCPDCGNDWELELDVAGFMWREIEILAIRLLRQVDVLARRYGWSEQAILALSPGRRRFYLELES